jgi:hypothetical protein
VTSDRRANAAGSASGAPPAPSAEDLGEQIPNEWSFGAAPVEAPPRGRLPLVAGAVAIVVVLAAAGWALLEWRDRAAPSSRAASAEGSRAEPTAPASPRGSEAMPAAAAADGTAAGSPSPSAAPAGTTSGRAGRVEVTTVRPVWLRVIVDGQQRAADLFGPGRTLTFDGREAVVIRAGDAGALRLTVDGRAVGAFGPDGAVLTRRIELAEPAAR